MRARRLCCQLPDQDGLSGALIDAIRPVFVMGRKMQIGPYAQVPFCVCAVDGPDIHVSFTEK